MSCGGMRSSGARRLAAPRERVEKAIDELALFFEEQAEAFDLLLVSHCHRVNE